VTGACVVCRDGVSNSCVLVTGVRAVEQFRATRDPLATYTAVQHVRRFRPQAIETAVSCARTHVCQNVTSLASESLFLMQWPKQSICMCCSCRYKHDYVV
jgi:hypothetical protein